MSAEPAQPAMLRGFGRSGQVWAPGWGAGPNRAGDVESGEAWPNPGRRARSPGRSLGTLDGLQASTEPPNVSFAQPLISICLIMVVLGVVPYYFVFWMLLFMLVLACVRVRIQAGQALDELQQIQGLPTAAVPRMYTRPGAGSAAPIIRMLPGGGGMLILNADPQTALDRIALQMHALDRELNASDYEGLLRLDQHGQARQALSDEDLAALPVHLYKAPRPRAAAEPHQAAAGAAQGAAAGAAGTSGGAPAGGTNPVGSAGGGAAPRSGQASPRAGAAAAAGGGDDDGGLCCPVCLDTAVEGSAVMTLPCLHQFHRDCIVPWLKQQGHGATCPMCKTNVFRS